MAEQRAIADPDPSPALGPDWHPSRWGAEDQRGNAKLRVRLESVQQRPSLRTSSMTEAA